MSDAILQYVTDAATKLLPPGRIAALKSALLTARDETLNDVELWQSGQPIPAEKQPLDAGFIQWPEELLLDAQENLQRSLIARVEACGARLRDAADSVVVLGGGGSYWGVRALFDALRGPFHNEQSRKMRGGIPRIYFEGWNVDSDRQQFLLNLLDERADSHPASADGRTAIIVISKSGGTLESAAAFRTFRTLIERRFGAEAKNLIVPVTGGCGRLRNLANAAGYPDVFSIPDGIGGRFSILTAVGLLPAAAAGMNILALLEGARCMTEHFRSAPFESNTILQYVAVGHAFETDQGIIHRILATWGSQLEAVGMWYDHLLGESPGRRERGVTPLTVVNPRDLHSRGRLDQECRRDKLITNLLPGRPQCPPIAVPKHELDHDQLNQLAGVTLPRLLQATIEGTNKACADERCPTTDLVLPTINEHVLGQLFQMLMLATVVEGRLVGTNPYRQPGVEAYRKNILANLAIR